MAYRLEVRKSGNPMTGITLLTALICLLVAPIARGEQPGQPSSRFPMIEQQLEAGHVIPGSALENLIRANQDFSRLLPRDASDRIVPPWLKVYWRKGHPEVDYDNPTDPTGGYPHVLKEVYEWMMSHQDFRPGLPEANIAPGRQVGDRDEDAEEEAERGARNPMTLLNPLAATPGTNVRTSGAQTASRSESDIRINYWSPSKIIAASNNIGGSGAQGQYYSSDGGVTWGQTTLPIASGDSFHSDPTVDWSSDGTAWSTTMGINAGATVLKVQSYKSVNGGATWTFDGTISGSQTNTDKQMQWIDHSASSAFANNNYVIWHNGNPAFMNRRTASGWGTPIQVSNTSATGTCIGADVKTNSAGDVFGFFPDTGSRGIFMVKSTNGGTSYGAPVKFVTTYDSYDIGVPSFSGRRILIYVSGGAYKNGATNNVYATWADLSGDTGCTAAGNEPGTVTTSACKTRTWFARSTDGGTTWGARVKVNNQAGLNDQFNPFLAVDETNGNIGLMYYDTVNDAGRKKVDIFYQMSTDGGATFAAAVKVTTAMTDETSAGADSGNQFGDYNSLSGYANAFFPSWTDRRSAAKEEIWTSKITTSSTPTYSISGNAGTTGALVSTGSASATSDASSNFTISSLAAGSYTVTPSKSGCTFTPASQSVTVGPNATGKNFTASCTTSYSISGNAGVAGASVSSGATSTTADASGNYTLSALAAGTYTVTPSSAGCTFTPASQSVTVGPNATGKNFTASCTTGDTQLTSGVTLNSQSVGLKVWKYYFITVPAGATNLTFTTTNATTDQDIYTRFNVKPTLTTYTCRPYGSSGNETCSATNPSAGTWYLGVYGYAAGTYSVTGTVTTATPTYAISGNAGTTGATVTAGTKTATSDASSNYSMTGFAAGTYTVTPSKAGCTFSPASLSVTLGPNATGKSFTATCGSAPTERLSNGGFATITTSTNTAADGSWTRSAFTGTSFNTLVAGTGGHAGAAYAVLGVNAATSTQKVDHAAIAIPAGATSVTLSFWVSIVTSESSTATTAYDKLAVQLVDASTGTVLSTLTTLSNLNPTGSATTYVQKTFNITTQKGKTVKVRFAGSTDVSLQTTFRVDDVSLKSDG